MVGKYILSGLLGTMSQSFSTLNACPTSVSIIFYHLLFHGTQIIYGLMYIKNLLRVNERADNFQDKFIVFKAFITWFKISKNKKIWMRQSTCLSKYEKKFKSREWQ